MNLFQGTLKILQLERCHVITPYPLHQLKLITQLNLKDNFIGMIDLVLNTVRGLSCLIELDLRFNYVQKVPKYRDHIIMIATKLCKILGFKYKQRFLTIRKQRTKKENISSVFFNRERIRTQETVYSALIFLRRNQKKTHLIQLVMQRRNKFTDQKT